jgi:hypothetical protein
MEILICLSSNRRVPGILREGPAFFILPIENIMDRLTRNILHVLWGPFRWDALRQLRPQMDPVHRHFPARFRCNGKF